MRWLNYHHLYYFWTVAKTGSVSLASKDLKLAQPTVSAQLKNLEDSLGEKLFMKEGRYLKLTDVGKVAFRYAEEIFSIGREFLDVIDGAAPARVPELRVGISDVVPKLVSYKILEPALSLDPPPRLVCQEDKTDRLLADLSIHELDLIICDTPIPPSVKVKAYNHLLGESGMSFLARREIAEQLRPGFPKSLTEAPFLLPTKGAAVRSELDRWFEAEGISPRVVAEFQDTALMKIFGREGAGILPAPHLVEREVCGELSLDVVGRTANVKERFYLVSVERKIKHPAVAAICQISQNELFPKARGGKRKQGKG